MTTISKLTDIVHVVPAMQPAWVHILERYEFTDDDGKTTKHWEDIVLPVLAYGTLPEGAGAYLVVDPCSSEGPCWMTYRPGQLETKVRLSVNQEPTRGNPPFGCNSFVKNHEYTEEQLSDLYESIHWLL